MLVILFGLFIYYIAIAQVTEKKVPTFPYGCLSGETNNYIFQFSTCCCVHPKDLFSGHVFIGCTDSFGLDAALCIKKHFVFWCPDGGSRRFYNRVHRKQWSSSKQPHCVLQRKSCLETSYCYLFCSLHPNTTQVTHAYLRTPGKQLWVMNYSGSPGRSELLPEAYRNFPL